MHGLGDAGSKVRNSAKSARFPAQSPPSGKDGNPSSNPAMVTPAGHGAPALPGSPARIREDPATHEGTQARVARVSPFAAQVLARNLVAAGRKDESETIRAFISTIVHDEPPTSHLPHRRTSGPNADDAST